MTIVNHIINQYIKTHWKQIINKVRINATVPIYNGFLSRHNQNSPIAIVRIEKASISMDFRILNKCKFENIVCVCNFQNNCMDTIVMWWCKQSKECWRFRIDADSDSLEQWMTFTFFRETKKQLNSLQGESWIMTGMRSLPKKMANKLEKTVCKRNVP